MQMNDVQTLRERIEHARSCGEVFLFVDERPAEDARNEVQLVDAFVGQHGFSEIGDQWREVTRDFAERTLIRLLSFDLAYRAPLVPETLARQFAKRFLGWFRSDVTFLTNHLVNSDETAVISGLSSYRSMPITDATFDAGIVAIDSALLGILWFADED